MNLETYDKTVAPPLSKIESGCGWLTYYARNIQSAVNVLPARPANETLARAGLNLAEQELMIALASVRAVRDIYDRLPVIIENYHREAAE
jgi:hypothetical protein